MSYIKFKKKTRSSTFRIETSVEKSKKAISFVLTNEGVDGWGVSFF